MLAQSISTLDHATRVRIDRLAAYFGNHGVADPATAAHKALVAIGGLVRKQAFIMAFSDTFFLLGVALVLALAASLMLTRSGPVDAGGAH
jgi:DHA2 family multidrug resistance protein